MRVKTPPISIDLPCSKCHYNLRGLPCDSLCPECGHPIPLSYDDFGPPDFPLTDSPPAHLRSVSRSILLTLIALLLASATPALRIAPHVRPYEQSTSLFTADLTARFLLCLAIFFLTRREPESPVPHASYAATVLRLAALGALTIPLAARYATLVESSLWLPLAMAGLLSFLAAGVYYWHLANIAARIPGGRRVEADLRLLIVLGPIILLFPHILGDEPRFAAAPLFPHGFPADDLAHFYHNPLRSQTPVKEFLFLIPVGLLAWSASLHVRLYRSLRALTPKPPVRPETPDSAR